MRYLSLDKETAVRYGFEPKAHLTNEDEMLVNEKEVMFTTGLSGSFTDRAEQLGGKVLSVKEAKEYINENDFK